MLKQKARTIIIGGGIAGLSSAYHLAKKGVKDIVVLERDQLTSGTTHHAAGLVGALASSQSVTKMRQFGQAFYTNLEKETGMATGFKRLGGVTIATNSERFELIKRWQRVAEAAGTRCEIISTERVKELCPLVNVDDVLGGLHSPMDGQINPIDAAMAVAAAARNLGVDIREKTVVTELVRKDDCILGVKTTKYDGEGEEQFWPASDVILCGGMWSKQLAESIAGDEKIICPLRACEHEYVVTEPVEQAKNHPVVRSYDEQLYIKEDAGKVLIGYFENGAKAAFKDSDGRVPMDFSWGNFEEDMDHMTPLLETAMHRLPCLAEAGLSTIFSGPESFTPDGREMIGKVPNLDNLYMLTGLNSHGIVCGPAIGRNMAELFLNDNGRNIAKSFWSQDIRRFQDWMNDVDFLGERAPESLGKQYAMVYPYEEPSSGRNIKLLPHHELLSQRGAVFGQSSVGFETPLFFEPNSNIRHELRFSNPQSWFPNVKEECLNTRNQAGLFDLSDYARFEVSGVDDSFIHQFEPRFGNVVAARNNASAIEAVFTISRLPERNKYIITCDGVLRTKLLEILQRKKGVTVKDITYETTLLGLFGPKAKHALKGAGITDIAMESIIVGVPGFQLLVANSESHRLLEKLLEMGGVTLCGKRAREILRMEAGPTNGTPLLDWSRDISESNSTVTICSAPTVEYIPPGEIVYNEKGEVVSDVLAACVSLSSAGKENILYLPEDQKRLASDGLHIIVGNEKVPVSLTDIPDENVTVFY